jgi:hypothetical protein
MKFAEVVVQGLEERFVDRNGMAHFGVMTASRIHDCLSDAILKMTNLMNMECRR